MSNTPDVLVVGAGPVGLTLACELLRHGLQPRLIDVAETASIYSKAQIVHIRTLELLEDMGIAERFLAAGLVARGFSVYDHGAKQRIIHLEVGEVGSRFRGVLNISQHTTELLLAEQLERLGGHIERSVKLVELTHDEQGVSATLEHLADGRREQLRVPYLVGCDGAHSTVRHELGIAFVGSKYPMTVIQTDARVDFPFEVEPDHITGVLGQGAIVGFFPLPGGDHHYRFLVPFGGAEPPSEAEVGYATKLAEELTLERFQAILDRVVPGAKVSEPRWMVGFHIHCRLAERFASGRVFLAGDAAHIHSPGGGQGMNMGMQDAYNLAWKLALVHRGHAGADLLASYEQERREVAAQTLAWTDTATRGGMANFTLSNSIAIALRNRFMNFVTSLGVTQSRASRLLSMVDVEYANSPICAEHRASLRETRVLGERDSEQPSLRSRANFGHGPTPGRRAPDVHVDPNVADSPRLHQLLHGTPHVLLLFDGAAATEQGYTNLSGIAERVRERFGELVRTYIIVPHDEVPAALEQRAAQVVLDPHGAYHETYGAQSECLYVVRPDGYVGYRCQPADGERLLAHLALTLRS